MSRVPRERGVKVHFVTEDYARRSDEQSSMSHMRKIIAKFRRRLFPLYFAYSLDGSNIGGRE